MPQPLTQKEVLRKVAKYESLADLEIGDVDFQDYAFKNELFFAGAFFTGKADFKGVQFLNGARFMSAKLLGAEGEGFLEKKFTGEGRVDFSWA